MGRSRKKSGHFPNSCVSGENPGAVAGLGHAEALQIADFRLQIDALRE
jgi:hypothetical protein